MKEVKKLLEKIEQTPNKIIEEAIDNLSKKMNKEEIENKKRMLRNFSEQGQGQRVFFEEDLELIRDILQELEQKESILDKVTDKLEEVRRELDDDGFGYYAQEITNILNIIEEREEK